MGTNEAVTPPFPNSDHWWVEISHAICLCCPSIACKTTRTLGTDESPIVPGLLEVLVFYTPLFRELSMEAVTVLT